MEYKKLGPTGLKISSLSYGSWVTFSNQLGIKDVVETLALAKDHGVNFFDNAEVYAGGKSETIMGEAFKKLQWSRLSYLVSTKFFWGIEDGVNSRNTLNRKYLLESIHGSLSRLQLDHVDLVYCHRPDPHTPMEEVVWAMSDLIQRGHALYWGTSEWTAEQIESAFQVAEKMNLRKPVVEQPEYNLFNRTKVEKDYLRLYEKYNYGLTTWSPLASGLLTGKYLDKIEPGTRAANPNLSFVTEAANDQNKKTQIRKFIELAKKIEASPHQLALAWCAKNKNVSSVIVGASRREQLVENLQSLKLMDLLTPQVMKELDQIFPQP